MTRITNAEFAARDKTFIRACVQCGVEGTRRQASKFRNKKGRVYQFFSRIKK